MGWLEQEINMILTTDRLEGDICDKLGLTREQLRKMDIGDVEEHMVKMGLPLRLEGTPRHPLYHVLGFYERRYVRAYVTKILGETPPELEYHRSRTIEELQNDGKG